MIPVSCRGMRDFHALYDANMRIHRQSVNKQGVRDILWRSGGQETPGRVEKVDVHLPPDIRLEPTPSYTTLNHMLNEGVGEVRITA